MCFYTLRHFHISVKSKLLAIFWHRSHGLLSACVTDTSNELTNGITIIIIKQKNLGGKRSFDLVTNTQPFPQTQSDPPVTRLRQDVCWS